MARRLLILLLAASLLFAGCLSGDDGQEPDRVPPDGGGDGQDPGGEDPPRERGTPAPELDVGQAWTYETDGLYNTGEELTIVVARADDQGYLLAGKEPIDLYEEVAWDRPWQGAVDREFVAAEGDGAGQPRLFDFPLQQGKTWSWGQSTVTSQAASVTTPQGELPGFIMTRTHEGELTAAWTYVPAFGYLTTYVSFQGNTTLLSLNLTGTSTGQTWAWFEPGPSLFIGGAEPDAGQLMVGAEHTAVVASAGGEHGGSTELVPAPTAQTPPWTQQFTDEQAWRYTALPAGQGPWLASTQAAPDGFAWLNAQAVTWTDGP